MSAPPGTVVAPDGSEHHMLNDDFAHVLRDSLDQLEWQRASEGYLAAGLGVPNLAPARKVRHKYLAEGKLAVAGMVIKVVSAAVFLAERRAASWPDQNIGPRCVHCGRAQTETHAYWTCPALKNHPHPDVKESNHLKDEAVYQLEQQRAKQEAMWM